MPMRRRAPAKLAEAAAGRKGREGDIVKRGFGVFLLDRAR
jgi:hypothetical protein